MTDQDKLAGTYPNERGICINFLTAVVDLNDNEILVYKDTTVVDKALFVGGKDLDSVKFENTTDAPKLWKATDENGPYTHGSLPECLKSGWRLEVGAVKYPITVKGQGVCCATFGQNQLVAVFACVFSSCIEITYFMKIKLLFVSFPQTRPAYCSRAFWTFMY